MRLSLVQLSPAILAVTMLNSACGKSEKESKAQSGGSIVPRILLAGSSYHLETDGMGPELVATAGQTTAASLKSLKYYVQNVQICQNIETQGSGFSSTSGCVTIYSNPDANQDAYQNYDITTAMADTSEDHWIDFMSETSRAKLTASPVTLTTDNVGDYKFGLINFMKTIKIDAEYKDASGTTRFYTKTPTAAEIITDAADSFGKRQHLTFSSTDPTVGPSSEMTVMNNNGGTLFRFLKPLSITADDITNNSGFKIDFVFNPANYSGAWGGSGSNCTDGIAPNICGGYDIPMGKLAPVPHKDGEAIKKEIYLVNNFSTNSNLRIELYYNDSDTTKSIMGVDRSMVIKSGATETDGNSMPYLYRAAEDANGVVTFYDYDQSTNDMTRVVVQDFARRASGTVVLPCPGAGAFGNECTSSSGSVSRTYTYVGTETVSAQ
jgi:hypothetical protein